MAELPAWRSQLDSLGSRLVYKWTSAFLPFKPLQILYCTIRHTDFHTDQKWVDSNPILRLTSADHTADQKWVSWDTLFWIWKCCDVEMDFASITLAVQNAKMGLHTVSELSNRTTSPPSLTEFYEHYTNVNMKKKYKQPALISENIIPKMMNTWKLWAEWITLLQKHHRRVNTIPQSNFRTSLEYKTERAMAFFRFWEEGSSASGSYNPL